MVGSSQSLAYSEVVLNTILADSFEQFANQLEPLEGEAVWQQVQCIIRDTMRSHSRVIYNGNNYSEQWVMEAQRRGLPILRTSVEAFATLTEQKNIELFDHHHIFSPKETAARYEIQLENYIHVLQIEASTMLEIAKRQIIPSVIGYSGKLAESLHRLEQCGLHPQRLENHLRMVSDSCDGIDRGTGNSAGTGTGTAAAVSVCAADVPTGSSGNGKAAGKMRRTGDGGGPP